MIWSSNDLTFIIIGPLPHHSTLAGGMADKLDLDLT